MVPVASMHSKTNSGMTPTDTLDPDPLCFHMKEHVSRQFDALERRCFIVNDPQECRPVGSAEATHVFRQTCPLCGGLQATTYLETNVRSPSGDVYHVMACPDCGLRYTNPVPTGSQELSTLYGSQYHHNRTSRLYELLQTILHWERRSTFSDRQPGRILDIGCAHGGFLRTLSDRGWETFGVDLSAAACELSRSRGLSVHCGTLTSAAFPAGFFDVVTAWHVIEHLQDPGPELSEIRRVLSDDGLLVVEVPNYDCLTARICGKRWWGLDTPRHLQHFDQGTLERLLKDHGFTPLRVKNHHSTDLSIAFHSFLHRLGLRSLFGIETISRDIGRMSLVSKLAFVAVALPIGLFSALYSLSAGLLTGKGESITVIADRSDHEKHTS